MRPGDPINGYELTTPFTTTGGGHCQWAFARRGDEEFFVKQFLKPTYPLPGGPGGEKTKAEKRARCERFARQHTEVKGKLAPLSGPGGNLVVTQDFFLHGSHYYKVTAKVDVSAGSMADICALPVEDKIKLMLMIASSVGILHQNGLVHGDIKPANILIERGATGLNTKLIDFDNCFPSGGPPPPDELVGDLVYYPPEMIDYVVGVGQGSHLTEKVDMFALGLTFAEYAGGGLPAFPSEYKYPGETVRHGLGLDLPDGPFHDLLAGLLDADPRARPSHTAVRDQLHRIRRILRSGGTVPSRKAAPADPLSDLDGAPDGTGAGRVAGTGPAGLRGRLLERVVRKTDEGTAVPPAEEIVPVPRLRGRLARPEPSERPGLSEPGLSEPGLSEPGLSERTEPSAPSGPRTGTLKGRLAPTPTPPVSDTYPERAE